MKYQLHSETLGYLISPRLQPNCIECAERPSEDHLLSDTWQDDPMNPAVCWRPKTIQELDQEAEVEADKELQQLKALKALAIWTGNQLGLDVTQSAVRQQIFQEIKSIYKQF